MESNIHSNLSGAQLCRHIQEKYQNTPLIIYRFDTRLKQLLWTSAVLAADLEPNNLKILKRIHIPLGGSGSFSKCLESGQPQLLHNQSELQGLYEQEFSRWYKFTGNLLLVPLMYQDQIQGLLLLFRKTEVTNIVHTPEELLSWGKYFFSLIEKIETIRLKKISQIKKLSVTKQKPASVILFLDINNLGDQLSEDHNQNTLKLITTIEQIFSQNILHSKSKIASITSWRMVAIRSQSKNGAIHLTMAAIKIRNALTELQKHTKINFLFKISLASGLIFKSRNAGRFRIWGNVLEFLDRLTRLAPSSHIQISESFARKINKNFITKIRGKIRFSKNGSERTLYLIENKR